VGDGDDEPVAACVKLCDNDGVDATDGVPVGDEVPLEDTVDACDGDAPRDIAWLGVDT
jgi:hypothetical protein